MSLPGAMHPQGGELPRANTPICRIIAGPNRAGKNTFALRYLRQFPDAQAFVNADLIAAGLSPLAPQQQLLAASRLMLSEIESHIPARQSFAFETTLSGRGYLRLINRLRTAGWRVALSTLRSPRLSYRSCGWRSGSHTGVTACPYPS
jgi:predicted ABC-type ATPase